MTSKQEDVVGEDVDVLKEVRCLLGATVRDCVKDI